MIATLRAQSASTHLEMSSDADLISQLEKLTVSPNKKGKHLLRSKDYDVPTNDSSIKVTSWRMQDYAYKAEPCPFPTRARGLFTSQQPEHKDRPILVRGYDKFFNVGEVSWTKVRYCFPCLATSKHTTTSGTL